MLKCAKSTANGETISVLYSIRWLQNVRTTPTKTYMYSHQKSSCYVCVWVCECFLHPKIPLFPVSSSDVVRTSDGCLGSQFMSRLLSITSPAVLHWAQYHHSYSAVTCSHTSYM